MSNERPRRKPLVSDVGAVSPQLSRFIAAMATGRIGAAKSLRTGFDQHRMQAGHFGDELTLLREAVVEFDDELPEHAWARSRLAQLEAAE